MHEMSLWVDPSTDPVRVVVAGELDLEGGDHLEALVERLVADDLAVALDLSKVEFMDSSGLGAVISVAQGPGDVRLEDASPAVLRVLETTGTTDVLDLGAPARMRGDLAHVWDGRPQVA